MQKVFVIHKKRNRGYLFANLKLVSKKIKVSTYLLKKSFKEHGYHESLEWKIYPIARVINAKRNTGKE